jgi:GTP-binding protein LepA
VDFAYEVPLAAACEGSLLVVDAAQGVEAQTLANVYARPSMSTTRSCRSSTRSTCRPPTRPGQGADRGCDRHRRLRRREISAKTGLGIEDVLEAIVTRLPPPKGGEPTRR